MYHCATLAFLKPAPRSSWEVRYTDAKSAAQMPWFAPANHASLPHSSFIVHHSSFIIHHSSFIIHNLPDLHAGEIRLLLQLWVIGDRAPLAQLGLGFA